MARLTCDGIKPKWLRGGVSASFIGSIVSIALYIVQPWGWMASLYKRHKGAIKRSTSQKKVGALGGLRAAESDVPKGS